MFQYVQYYNLYLYIPVTSVRKNRNINVLKKYNGQLI